MARKVTVEFTEEDIDTYEGIFAKAPDFYGALGELYQELRKWRKYGEQESKTKDEMWAMFIQILANNSLTTEDIT